MYSRQAHYPILPTLARHTRTHVSWNCRVQSSPRGFELECGLVLRVDIALHWLPPPPCLPPPCRGCCCWRPAPASGVPRSLSPPSDKIFFISMIAMSSHKRQYIANTQSPRRLLTITTLSRTGRAVTPCWCTWAWPRPGSTWTPGKL